MASQQNAWHEEEEVGQLGFIYRSELTEWSTFQYVEQLKMKPIMKVG